MTVKRRGRVATSRTNKFDKHETILVNTHVDTGKGVRMMVTEEFDGAKVKITGQHEATNHKNRLANRHKLERPKQRVELAATV